VHIDTVGAAIDLGCAELYEFEQGSFKAAGIDISLKSGHGAQGLWRGLVRIEAWFHFSLLSRAFV
jgi:hypothetical protein